MNNNKEQGVPKGTDTLQSFMIKNWITYESFFQITKVSIKCNFFNNFGKTVNLSFNGLTGVNSLCSISNPYVAENAILNNFNSHGGLSKSFIFRVTAIANSQISGNLK